jgi:Transcription factor WhiB
MGAASAAQQPGASLAFADDPRCACKRYPAGWWFAPDEEDGTTLDDQAAAIAICQTECPPALRGACLAYAFTAGEAGVWGGFSLPPTTAELPALLAALPRRVA